MKNATATSHGNKRVLAAAGAGSTVDGMDALRELIRKVNQEKPIQRKHNSSIPTTGRDRPEETDWTRL
jgi:hypothetical protein